MAFSSWRGVVGMINPTMRPGVTEEVCRLLPEGIGLIPLFLNIRRGTEDEIRDHDAALRKARRGAGRAEMRSDPSARRAALHGAGPQGRGQNRRGLGEEIQGADHERGAEPRQRAATRSRPRASSAPPISRPSSTPSSPNISAMPASTVRGMEGIDVPFNQVQTLSGEQVYAHIKKNFLKAKGADAIYMLGSGWRTLNIIDDAGAGPAGAGGASGAGAGLGNPEAAARAPAGQGLRAFAGGVPVKIVGASEAASVAFRDAAIRNMGGS